MPARLSIRMAVCLAVSLALHLTVLWPAMGRALASAPPGATDPPPPIQPLMPPPVEPGVESSDASTLTWVGYDEYREHLAQLASVDQAAFATDPGGSARDASAAGDGGTPDAGALVAADSPADPAEPVEPTDPAERVEPTDPVAASDSADAADAADAVDPITPVEVPPVDAPVEPAGDAADGRVGRRLADDAVEPAAVDGPERAEGSPRPLVEIAADGPLSLDRPPLVGGAPPSEAPAEMASSGAAASESSDAEADRVVLDRLISELRSAVAAFQALTPRGGQGGEAEATVVGRGVDAQDGESIPREGEISDRESIATSRIDVPRDRLRPDRPIAREGLEIRTRDPRFQSIERLTASPGNPIVLISFGRDGVPVKATLLKGTGDSRIDHAITSSLFMWRASGARLTALPPDGTIDLEFRIVLTGRG